MTDLQCPARVFVTTIRVLDGAGLAAATDTLRTERISAVHCTGASTRPAAGRLADSLGVRMVETPGLRDFSLAAESLSAESLSAGPLPTESLSAGSALDQIADEYRGEAVVLVTDAGPAMVQLTVDSAGWRITDPHPR